MPEIGLFERAKDLPGRGTSITSRQFGGIRVFADSESRLKNGIEFIGGTIVRIAGQNCGIAPSMLRYLVSEDIGSPVPKRVFSALCGYHLRLGILDSIVCEGPKGNAFRVILHRDQLREFNGRVRDVGAEVTSCGIVRIFDLRDRYYPGRPKGSWTQAMLIGARLVRLGIADYKDQYTFKKASAVSNAILHTNGCLNAPNA
jgi:hypothetical protein